MTYNQLATALSTVPATWVPALLRVLIRRAVSQNVFRPGGLVRFVEQTLEGK